MEILIVHRELLRCGIDRAALPENVSDINNAWWNVLVAEPYRMY